MVDIKNILKGSNENYVYVNVDGQAKRRPVIQGERQNLDIEIKDGLNPGDQLVVEGQLLLNEGSKLNIIE